MTVLLDTHAFLWFVLNDPRLGERAKQTIEENSNSVLLSPASFWEIAIKISAGKYRLTSSFEEFWRSGMLENRISILPIEVHHTARLLALPFHHKDPFDRLLIAQSLVENIAIVGCDTRFDAYGNQRIW